jgi:hypothetical protein
MPFPTLALLLTLLGDAEFAYTNGAMRRKPYYAPKIPCVIHGYLQYKSAGVV